MKLTTAAALCGIALACSVATADARPRHHHRHVHHHAMHHVASPGGGEGFRWYSSDLVAKARSYLGDTAGQLGLPRSLWCADFMNMLLGGGTGSRQARSYLHYGHRVSGPRVGAIAVLVRRGGGHVGVVSGVDGNGNPIIISGNHNHRVGEGVYPKGLVIAYVEP